MAATAYVTVPFPLPLLPPVTVIQLSLLEAAQLQPLPAATLTLAPSPAAATVWLVGDTAKLHAALLCVTVTVCPATVSVPLREVVAVLAATVYMTVPFPLPLPPPVTVIQLLLLVAVQLQPLPAATLTLAPSPAAATVWLVGDTAKVHGAEKENVLEKLLRPTPPGPMAATAA